MTARNVGKEEQRLARLLGLYGAVIFIASGAAVTLLPLNPRYFSAPAFVAALLLGMAMAHVWRRNKGAAMAILAVVVGSNIIGAYAENRHSVYGVRAYAALAERAAEPVHTDPMTRYRAELLLKWNNAEAQAVAKPPAPGALYFWNPALAASPNARMSAAEVALYARPKGKLLLTTQPPPDAALRVLETTGLKRFVPSGVWYKLANRHPKAELIRVD